MFYGYVYALTDGESVVVLHTSEHASRDSLIRLTRTLKGAERASFLTTVSLIQPVPAYEDTRAVRRSR